MAITIYNIKKWTNMILGKSQYHVNQEEGKIYSINSVKGYYNDLTEKVTKFGDKSGNVPKTKMDSINTIYFPIAIFQYGLASYDLFLLNNDKEYLKNVYACADWAVKHQNKNGGWKTFAFKKVKNPYSSMSQGEGISLLIRAYIVSKNKKYLISADNAYRFLLTSINKGGTAKYDNEHLTLYESPNDPLILNGWIFSLWGIYDYWLFYRKKEIKDVWEQSIETLESMLPLFDCGYWSKYDEKNRLCSPFYHKLHIHQLNVMYSLTKKETFIFYSKKWEKYMNNPFYKFKAIISKTFQKINE